MMMQFGVNKKVALVIVGGGPAGMAAALKAYDEGQKETMPWAVFFVNVFITASDCTVLAKSLQVLNTRTDMKSRFWRKRFLSCSTQW